MIVPFIRHSVFCCCLLVCHSVFAEAPTPTPAQLTARLETVQALLGALQRQHAAAADIAQLEAALSAARQALAAGDAAAATQVEALYQRTKRTLAAMQSGGDIKSGSAALAESRQQEAQQSDTPVLRALYARQEASLAALLGAVVRVAADKGGGPTELQALQQQHAAAQALAAQGRYREAIGQLETTYPLVRQALRALRQGDELVADKNFATPALEFAYERSRNDDYLGLIGTVLAAAQNAAWGEIAVRARSLRDAAERAAREEAWDVALERIAGSTGELKAILKLAGFPIM
jgi:hypothetical protein